MKNKSGFTLIEILIVIGILAILASIVALAINPARQFARANDMTRRSDLNSVMSAVYQYAVDEQGDFSGLTTLTDTYQEICSTASCASKVNLAAIPIISIPKDPGCGGTACAIVEGPPHHCDDTDGTGYWIKRDTGVVYIEARCTQVGSNIILDQ